MRKKFSLHDPISRRLKHDKAPEPAPEPVEEAPEPRRPRRAKARSGPIILVGGVALSVIIFVFAMASAGRGATKNKSVALVQRSAAHVKPLKATKLPLDVWTEHKQASEPEPAPGPADPPVQPPKKQPPPPTVVVVPIEDAEHDLFEFDTPPPVPPKNLGEDVKKADELLEKGKKLLRAWYETRSRKTIVEARTVLEQAVDAYREAAKANPDDSYVRKQTEAANKLHYVAIKSSPF